MPLFIIIAYDRNDADQIKRRKTARVAHVPLIRELAAQRKLVVGGGILDDHGTVIGSVGIYDFEDRDELDAYLRAEPYNQDVWGDVTVKPFFLAFLDGEEMPFPDSLLAERPAEAG